MCRSGNEGAEVAPRRCASPAICGTSGAPVDTDFLRASISKQATIASTTTDTDVLDRALEHGKPGVRAAAMANPLTDPALLEAAARAPLMMTPAVPTKERRARAAAISAAMNALGNPSTPDDALLEVVKDGAPRYRQRAALTLAVKGRAVEVMDSTDVSVREIAVRNAGATVLPPSVAYDTSLRVRVAVAESSADPGLLAELACSDADIVTQSALARNPHSDVTEVPTTRTSSTSTMQPVDVARFARATPGDITRAYRQSRDRATRVALGLHANAPAFLQIRVLKGQRVEVRAAVASRENTSPKVLAVLAHDPDPSVLRAVLNNERVPDAAIAHLTKLRNREIRTHARMLLGG